MRKFVIDEQILQATINYFSAQPYNEVANFIDVLRKLPEVEIKEEKETKKDETKGTDSNK